ncbi:MAG TPA: hypothetical protein VIV58_16380 [Kofleriaceae bacterium]
MSRRALILASAVLGLIGTIGMAIGFVTEPTQAAFSYLTAWLFAFSIAIGGLVLLLISHATGAKWLIAFRRFIEAITSALPILALLFVPVALSVHRLYAWVDPSPAMAPEDLAKLVHKAPYLNVTFWAIRAAIFFVAWSVLGELLVRWGRRLGTDAPKYRQRLATLSAPGLPFVALTLTFAVFDWLMSLTPLWWSTVFGLLFWSGGFLAALCVVAVVARDSRRVPEVAAAITPDLTGAIGRMMFAFLCFWAYMEFSQGIIIWIANKPGEVPWYVARGAAAWGTVFGIIIVGHFALPFFTLLNRSLKRHPTPLALVGWWLLLMHYVDVYWLVMPVAHANIGLHWLDFAAPLAVVGITVALVALRTRSVLPAEDPLLAKALSFKAKPS